MCSCVLDSDFLSGAPLNHSKMLQLNPPLPVATVKGPGYAHFLIDYGQEHHLIWVVFLRETGECWSLLNKDIRLEANTTLGTGKDAWFSSKTD